MSDFRNARRERTVNKDDLIKALTDYEMLVVDQRNRLINIRLRIEKKEDPKDLVNEFAKENEEIFLKLKALSSEISGERPDDKAHLYGKTDISTATLDEIKPGIWKFLLPPLFSTSSGNVMYNEGAFTYYLVCRLIEDFNEPISAIKKPLIVFRHHIQTGKNLTFFYDSIDIKRAIDAMKETILREANTGAFTVMHDTIEGSEEPYCEVFVTEKDRFVELQKLALCSEKI